MLQLPPIYPITDARSGVPLSVQVKRLGEAGFPLVQFRGKPLDAGTQFRELAAALAAAEADGGWPAICVNDRADLAVLAAWGGRIPWGLHLGQTDLPAGAARGLPGLGRAHLGGSTHQPSEWNAPDPAWDHAGVGPVRATATKPGHAEPLGLEGLRAGCLVLRAAGVAPVAIGGLTAADARDCFQAGAEAMAMVGEVARSAAPGELLWQAQAERWRSRPPIVPGQGVLLLGGSGAGKSTLARHLAHRLGLPARDADQRVESMRGATIGEIFAAEGEAGFRALEARAVGECLASPAVVAAGAGAWEDPATREAVRAAGFSALWLAEVPAKAWARVGRDPGRPLAAARESFMARWAARMAAWWLAPMLLPLGRPPETLADALAGGMDRC
jgi:thiamine-phosphate diphosphorylase